MKANKLADLLGAVTEFFTFSNPSRQTDEIYQLVNKLRASSKLDLLVVAFLLGRTAMAKQQGEVMIHDLLNKVAAFQKASGANAAAKKSRELGDAFTSGGTEGTTLVHLSSKLDGFDTIAAFVAKLNAAKGDRAEFDRILSFLTKRGTVTKPQMCKIAHRYAGGPKNYPSASKATLAIQQKFTSDMLFASKIA